MYVARGVADSIGETHVAKRFQKRGVWYCRVSHTQDVERTIRLGLGFIAALALGHDGGAKAGAEIFGKGVQL